MQKIIRNAVPVGIGRVIATKVVSGLAVADHLVVML
jgi:hypothetical protein